MDLDKGSPVVASALLDLEKGKPMGGGDSGCEMVGDDGGIGKVTRSARIGSANKSALEFGVPMYMDSVIWDARTV